MSSPQHQPASPALTTLIQRSGLPSPALGEAQAHAVLQTHYGIAGNLSALGSQQDLNFRVDAPQGRFVLKACHGSYAQVELEAQHAALAYLREQGLPVPAVRPASDGQMLLALEIDGQPLRMRLLDYIEGQPLTRLKHMEPRLMAELGGLCARLDKALATFDHPGLTRTLQWDPQHAQALIQHLLPVLGNAEQRARIERATQLAAEHLAPLVDQLPSQAVHLDITDENAVWARDVERQWQLQGVIDFGDLLRTWRIADLSVTCAALLHHAEGDPLRILPAVRAYQALNPLSEAELRALWPLVLNRAAVLVLSSEQQLAVDPGNQYTRDNIAHEWEIFDTATAVPFALMEAAILQAAGLQPATPDLSGCALLLPELDLQAVTRVDLGVLSVHCESGNWEQPGFDQHLLTTQPAPACSLHGQYRLSQTHIDRPEEPATCALGVELHVPNGSLVQAPDAGTWQRHGDGRGCLRSAHWALWLQGLDLDRQQVEGSGDWMARSETANEHVERDRKLVLHPLAGAVRPVLEEHQGKHRAHDQSECPDHQDLAEGDARQQGGHEHQDDEENGDRCEEDHQHEPAGRDRYLRGDQHTLEAPPEMLQHWRKIGWKRALASPKQAHGLLAVAPFRNHPQPQVDRPADGAAVRHRANDDFDEEQHRAEGAAEDQRFDPGLVHPSSFASGRNRSAESETPWAMTCSMNFGRIPVASNLPRTCPSGLRPV